MFTKREPIKIMKDREVYKMIKVCHTKLFLKTHQSYFLRYFSIYLSYEYEPNRLCKTDILVKSAVGGVELYSGFDEKSSKGFECTNDFNVISCGFHSAISPERLKGLHGSDSIGIFIIPKGSTVYRDESGLLVSDQIIFTGKMYE